VGVDTIPWLAAYVNLFSGHETQIWIYSSLEAETAAPGSARDDQSHQETQDYYTANFSRITPEKKDLARAQVWSLMVFIKEKLLPEYLAFVDRTTAQHDNIRKCEVSTNDDWVPKIPKHPPQSFLLGSLHTGVMTLLSTTNSYVDLAPLPGLKIHRYDVPPYVKYLFHPSIYQSVSEHRLPTGYRYADIKERRGLLPHHLELVISRTNIPRTRETLMRMPGVVVYFDGNTAALEEQEEMPVAWGFLAVDGSLATLHVEPEHRGQGLAAILSKEIMRTAMIAQTEDGKGVFSFLDDDQDTEGDRDAYTHADVATTNGASRRVMEKIGGDLAWTDTWTVLELIELEPFRIDRIGIHPALM
jgi:GNAT superfamily N-acetyltransferase